MAVKHNNVLLNQITGCLYWSINKQCFTKPDYRMSLLVNQ
jgi:hypothetical protein